jgi:tRNA-specific 2-thiouridylase
VEEARVEGASGVCRLLKGVDPVKDQTYFLSYLHQSQLSRCLFPVGGLPKDEVRELAARYELPNRDRPDSQGICFLGKIHFEEFVEHHLGTRVGEIRERETDRVLGEHRGFWFHTIGQRRGLGLSQGPWYVVEKDLERNIVYVSHTESLADHRRGEFEIGTPHWIAGPPTGAPLSLKLRHGERVYVCRLDLHGDDGGQVTLEGEDAGIAAGQFAVFYEDDVCLGAAPIER